MRFSLAAVKNGGAGKSRLKMRYAGCPVAAISEYVQGVRAASFCGDIRGSVIPGHPFIEDQTQGASLFLLSLAYILILLRYHKDHNAITMDHQRVQYIPVYPSVDIGEHRNRRPFDHGHDRRHMRSAKTRSRIKATQC